ncbi:Hypothetical protein PHPALM_12832 [Phytophthora palmivora]|uniref:ZSWIM1/3 RNaseH-like domain-containing protein n=1 Tax=Phytophthora palmivora TaxID=4796 RepID=A0A2P4XYR6_9STRA|nr:Hypothetical protein PHPALM_12832 [Phytophthora palmivora]
MFYIQNHTHSHPTSDMQASTYLTTKPLPLDDQDREDVKALADARVSSKHITNLLNDRIGCKVTPQQTRNLIRSIMAHDSGEDRLKDMLHALRQLEGSDVLVIQDQIDTKVQKIMFERWGETLTMDFTHGTNNIGYHLGSLVVTTATGRGFPVVDFICLNEYAVTINTILDYFKETNPMWSNVRSVVIDKDLWNGKCSRNAFRKRKFCFVIQSEDLLILMTKLLYSCTEEIYNTGYDALDLYCKVNKKQAFFAYFEKDWNSCH